MYKAKLPFAIVAAVIAGALGLALLLIVNSAPYSTPEKAIAAFISAESRADLQSMEKPASPAVFQNFVGHFGEAKYREIRAIYEQAYSQAEPKWAEYREKARSAAVKEHARIAEEINKAGRDVFAALPTDERLKLMEDHQRFNDFVFEEGLKAIPTTDRGKIADPQAFRHNRDIKDFTDREGFAMLPQEDRDTLKTLAAISAKATPDRIAFLESIGVPKLTAKQREAIAGIPSADLRNPQQFMQRYGRTPAEEFLKTSALAARVAVVKCDFANEEQFGSLFQGSVAECRFNIQVRGEEIGVEANMLKEHGAWKIASLSPGLQELRAAYPPRPARRNAEENPAPESTSDSAPQAEAADEPLMPTEGPVDTVRIPNASWSQLPNPAAATLESDAVLVAIATLFKTSFARLMTALFLLFTVVVFCVIMTINFKRLRQERFLPEWLEGEIPLEEIEVSHWWSRVWLRLTNKRIIQVRLSWFFSRRRVFGVALDDIHSVTWRRYINWLLILVGVLLFGRSNPIALLILMWGLESRILQIRFSTPLAQMPFPRARASVTSFRRGQFDELASFYKKAQLYLAQVRTQKQFPVQRNVRFMPEEDKDFSWGLPVWAFVVLWLLIALGQRTLGDHVTLEGIAGAVLLGLPIAAAAQSFRSGMWSAVLGACSLVAIKFPGSVGLLLLASSDDGGLPNLKQYLLLGAGAAFVAAVAYQLSRVHPLATFAASFLWVAPLALMQPALLGETRTYAICLIAAAVAAAFSAIAEAAAGKPTPSAKPSVETVGA